MLKPTSLQLLRSKAMQQFSDRRIDNPEMATTLAWLRAVCSTLVTEGYLTQEQFNAITEKEGDIIEMGPIVKQQEEGEE